MYASDGLLNYSTKEVFNSYWDYLFIDTRSLEDYNSSHLGPSICIHSISDDIWTQLLNAAPERKEKVIFISNEENKGANTNIMKYFVNNKEQFCKSLRCKQLPTMYECDNYEEIQKQWPFLCTPLYDYTIVYPSCIDNNLFLSSYSCAESNLVMEHLNIKAIVNCTNDLLNAFDGKGIEYYRVPIDDSLNDTIVPYVNNVIEFIESNIHSPILVHCQRGQSRSSSIVIAYLMKKYSWNYQTAYSFVRESRPISPNTAFVSQLKQLNF